MSVTLKSIKIFRNCIWSMYAQSLIKKLSQRTWPEVIFLYQGICEFEYPQKLTLEIINVTALVCQYYKDGRNYIGIYRK